MRAKFIYKSITTELPNCMLHLHSKKCRFDYLSYLVMLRNDRTRKIIHIAHRFQGHLNVDSNLMVKCEASIHLFSATSKLFPSKTIFLKWFFFWNDPSKTLTSAEKQAKKLSDYTMILQDNLKYLFYESCRNATVPCINGCKPSLF